jgi:tetratricopeptide (TPR) repeat protein
MNEAKIRTRHLKYFSQLAEEAESALRGPKQAEWCARLDQERDNIRTALEWATKTDVEAGLYLCARLRRFWENFDLREGARWLVEFNSNIESHKYPLARAKALLVHGRILGMFQQFTQARSAAQESLELFKALGNRQGEIDALLLLGYVRFSLDSGQDVELHQQALALAQSLGDKWRQACALWQLGWNYSGEKRFAYWNQAIILFRECGDWNWLAGVLSTFGNFALLYGNFDLAHERLDEASQVNEQLKDKTTTMGLLHARGRLAMIQGDYKQARTYWQEELGITEELGNRVNLLSCRTLLGYLAMREGNINEARSIFFQTAYNFHKDQDVIGVVFSLEGMAEFYIRVNKPNIATLLIGWSDITRQDFGDPRPPLEQADVDKTIAACIAKIGKVAFSDTYEEGQKMTLDEAIAYALGDS